MHLLQSAARVSAALSLALAAGLAFAIPDKDPVAYESGSPRDFPAQIAGIEAGMQDGGAYAGLELKQQERVRELLADMAGVLDGVKSVDRLSPTKMARLFNAQEEANALLTGRPINERMECKLERKVGSNLSHMNCQVIAERDERRAIDSQAIRDLRQTPGSGVPRPDGL